MWKDLPHVDVCTAVARRGWAGFQLRAGRGGGVDRPPRKKAQLTGPQNPTETDPLGPGGGTDPESGKK